MIDTVLKMLRKGRPEADGLDVFSRLLFASAFDQSLTGLDNEKLARFASDAFSFIIKKTHKRHSINIRRSDLLAGAVRTIGGANASRSAIVNMKPGGVTQSAASQSTAVSTPAVAGSVTLIEILNDDMPYVVESVMGEIHSRGLRPLLVFHPIFKVKRFGSGRLTGVVGPGDRNWASGDQESYVAVLVDGLDAQAASDLVAALDAVLDDVRYAVTDADMMRAKLQQAIVGYETLPMAIGSSGEGLVPGEVKEAVEFLKWLTRGNFTLLGLRDYEFVGTESAADLWPVTNGALGILKAPEVQVLRRGAATLKITPEIRAFYGSASPLIISKASATSRVRDRAHLDYVGVKRYGPNGSLVGEMRLVGLFTPAAYLRPVEVVPVIRVKVRKVLALAQFPADSHSGRSLVDILENFPRDELFQIDQGHLQAWAMALLDLSLRPRTRVLARRDSFNRYYSVLVFVPRDLYSSSTRERIGRYLADTFSGRVAAYHPYISTAPLVRIQFIIGLGSNQPRDVPDAVLEHDVSELLRTWSDRLETAMAGQPAALIAAYKAAFSAGYTETFPIERAVQDIARIERLGPDRPVAIDFYRETGAPLQRVRAAVYRFDTPIPLSERVPLLENLGFRVIDERSYHIRPHLERGERDIVLHDMVLESANGRAIDLADSDERMENCFVAVFNGEAEDDPFNALVEAAGFSWREAAVLRAYASYLRQIRTPFGPRYVAQTLIGHPDVARKLYDIFRARFDPDRPPTATPRAQAVADLVQGIETALATVASLEEDRVLRRMLDVVMATVRTNVFASPPDKAPPETIAFKFEPRLIDGLPEPRPFREIWVSSPRVEGVHLRFAPIARGGIRWSDRPQDFRTEVLGLAKAQTVKNTVIVPSGAKGGFVPRRQRRDATRDDVLLEGVASYRIFIEALLSLTDTIDTSALVSGDQGPKSGSPDKGRIVKPARVVCLDDDDPYLVVAADKGTATFSDYANQISIAHGFWLGDAFASGGSAGFDHKKMAITARGAWECVKRHFQEMDVDIQTSPCRTIGIGDMSGDVFGNAMLLSPALLLVAAFDHRDIFIDPSPDAARSLAERRRLFAMPRSSWQDYDSTQISTGGGVYSRDAKAIALTPQVKVLVGATVDTMPPNELIQALLRCPVDLLWFGGIGTFIRATSEADEQVGDRANDAIRITADLIGAKVIGEGANLGVTQKGRIEAAARGVRINTDFIDNSAGVNTSDQEVNIKIALAPAVASQRLTLPARDALLAQMSSDVAAAVLVNNRQQALALSLAERSSRRDITMLARLARRLEESGLITRKLESLPTGAEFTARGEAGSGLSRPELAVLLSWAKIALNAELLASPVPEDPAFEPLLAEYFPPALRSGYAIEIRTHRLRREIVATRVTNSMINRGGPALIERVAAVLGIDAAPPPAAEVAHAFLAARTIFGLPEIWSELEALDGRIAGQLQLDLYQKAQDLLVDQTAKVLVERRGRTFADMISTYRPAAQTLSRTAFEVTAPGQRDALLGDAARYVAGGAPDALARRFAAFDVVRSTIALADGAMEAGNTPDVTARVLFGVPDYLRLPEFRSRVESLKAADEFDSQAIHDAMAVIEGANTSLIGRMLKVPATTGMASVADWIAANAPEVADAKPLIETILSQPDLTVSRLTVMAAKLRGSGTADPVAEATDKKVGTA